MNEKVTIHQHFQSPISIVSLELK